MARSVNVFFLGMLELWEKEFQDNPNDRANWVGPLLIGTKYGVTPEIYASHFGIELDMVNETLIKAITLSEASNIGYHRYYLKPKLDKLPWGVLLEAVTDAGYNMGPGMAVRGLQGLLGTKRDGDIGPKTQAAYQAYISAHGVGFTVWAFYRWRVGYYAHIVSHRHEQATFINGWIARAGHYTPANEAWYLCSGST